MVELGLIRMCRLVLKSPDQKRIQQLISEVNLIIVNQNPDKFPKRFVTVDKKKHQI
jgi:hypothetical protein